MVSIGRMLQNWDFHLHRVSKESAVVIDQIVSIPMLHLTALAPDLHLYVGTLDRVRKLRHQLSGLCRYLNTCKKVSGKEGWKRTTSKYKNKEYLLEHTDIYSVQDLVRVHMDLMGPELRECVMEGISHVKSCPVCQAQAYICEVSSSMVQYSTVQYSIGQYSIGQYRTVQYSIGQYGTVQYSTVQHRIV